MTSKVNIALSNGKILNFNLNNVDVSIANGLRRIILTNIPTAVFDEKNMIFYKNTSRLHNEILKHRLTCIPLFINDLTIPLQNYMIEINSKNEGEDIKYITTQDFKIKNLKNEKYLTEDQVKKIFPPNPTTKDFILFARLRPKIIKDMQGEELHIHSKITVSTAEENGMYNVVHTASYSNEIDPIIQNQEWKKYLAQLTKLALTGEQVELEKKNWHNHQGKRYYKQNSFNFTIETLGNYTNEEIIQKACEIMIEKLKKIIENKDNFIYTESETTLPYSYDITLQNEDYTVGKVIESILYHEYYIKSKILSYAGFSKVHPHDSDSIVRIAFTKEVSSDTIYPLMTEVCLKSIQIYEKIKSYF